MSASVFFISTLLVISLIYHFVLKIFSDNSKKRIEKWTNTIFITVGAFIANYYAVEGLSEIEKTDYAIGYPIGITFLMYVIRGFYEFLFSPSNIFLSVEDEKQPSFYKLREYKKVSESDDKKIAIYPRITIRDIELELDWKNPKHIIFDSSDFVVINKTFGAFDGFQESFSIGDQFRFKDDFLMAEKVQVDFISVYDDYSGGLFDKHTKAYEGKDTPYHIQIIVWARRIKKG